jgi:uncharacterized membrane protein
MPAGGSASKERGGEFLNVREEMIKRRSTIGKAIDAGGRKLANPTAFVLLLGFHLLWIALNLPGLPLVEPWDPPPFPLLATIASALAPFVSIMILMAQYRDARITELREEVALQIALRSDRQLTLLLRALDERARAVRDGYDVDALEDPLHPEELLDRVRKHLEQAEGTTTGERTADTEDTASASPAPSG